MARMLGKLAALSALVAGVSAQQVGKETTETHPKMTWQKCTKPGSCTTVNGEVTIDANWRWTHDTKGYSNCYNGNSCKQHPGLLTLPLDVPRVPDT